MEFISRITSAFEPQHIIADLTDSLTGSFDLGIIFVNPWPQYDPTALYQDLKSKVNVRHLLLCTAAGIIGSNSEIEGRPSISFMLARLPYVSIDPIYLNQTTLDGLKSPQLWYEFLEIYPNEQPSFFFFPDPFSLSINTLLAGLNTAYKGCPVLGGLASAGSQPRENVLMIDKDMHREGAIGFCLRGRIEVKTVVSQGCRPIGETYIVTKASNNIIFELAGRPFVSVLEDLLKSSSISDQQLAHEAIFIGIVTDEYKDHYQRGDFLIRGLLGVDVKLGAGAIGDIIQPGQTVQFHLRDAKTATEDLNALLHEQKSQMNGLNPAGALVFSCNGRGMNLFKEEHHDIRIIQKHIGLVPASGFFCSGEIGPIGKINFLHGFTNSIALFYPL